jgi:hypothetical protein
MTKFGGDGAKRVLLRQALGGDQFLRVTWHERTGVFVFSCWEGDTCTSATPVRVEELGELATLIVTALSERISATAATWPPPSAASIVPAHLVRPA